ncbi:MAG TPA: hypothetical protein PLB01_01875 [Thermoanaerobaculia bacterium]|nr:hypothetical protein [Thermoanaerobaculia bacterium]
MRTRPAAFALLAALVATGCASSDWAKTQSVPGGKLYIPKLYAPLLPGSIYPDKKVPLPAKGRPALVVACPAKGDCRKDVILDQAAHRGFVVLVGREPKDDLLRTRVEADAERIGWLLVRPDEDFLRRWTRAGAQGAATAVIGPPPFPSYPSKHLLFAALHSAEPPEARDGMVLKLYSPNEKGLLPNEAFRDAVEWLAGELDSK